MGTYRGIPKTVYWLGIVSLFNDLAGEMVYPVLPAFLASLGGGALALGLIEGVADTTASLIKLYSGFWADRVGKRKPLVLWGYSLSAITKPLLAGATTWAQILWIRFTDRAGKGIRTSPRDALISDATAAEHQSTSFGFHRAFDHAGGVLGPLIAAGLLLLPGMGPRLVFLIATVPACLSVWILLKKVEDIPKLSQARSSALSLSLAFRELKGSFRFFLFLVFIFSLGLSSDALILLYFTKQGFSAFDVSLIWSAHTFVKMLSNLYLSPWADRYGDRYMLMIGWVLYALSYFALAFILEPHWMVGVFLIYGICFGFLEPAEKGMVARLAPPSLLGSAFGLFHFTVGIAMLPASLIFGFLWQWQDASLAFIAGGSFALLAAILLLFLPKIKKPIGPID